MQWSRTSRFAAGPTSPEMARSFVTLALTSLYRDPAVIRTTCDDVVVIVSELVTNAVQARSSAVEITLEVQEGDVVIAVTDRARGLPVARQHAAPDQPHGRGLAIVAALSREWGIAASPEPGPGKTVWARVELAAAPDVRSGES